MRFIKADCCNNQPPRSRGLNIIKMYVSLASQFNATVNLPGSSSPSSE